MRSGRISVASLALALAACEVGPNYEQPKVNVPASFIGAKDAAVAETDAGADLSVWWRQFGDPMLDRLIGQALAQNLDILTAAARISETREQEIINGAAGLPSVSAMGSAVRIHSNSSPFAQLLGGGAGPPAGASAGSGSQSGSSGSAAAGGSTGSGSASGGSAGSGTGAVSATPVPASGGSTIKLYSLGFDATWEIDFFGGVARNVETAEAKTQAAIWTLRDTEVTLTAEVARDYFALREAQARIAILNAELAGQRETLAVSSAKAMTGFVSYLDVNQASAQEAETAAGIPPLEAEIRVNIDALGVLLGIAPEDVAAEITGGGAAPPVPAALPVGLPSDLLRRRPDIREAERNLASATALVGNAMAQLYPKFDIIGLASFTSNSLGTLLETKNLTYGGIGLINWPIFTAGRLQATVRQKEDQENEAYFSYKASILKALQDAEDSLARYTADRRRLIELNRQVTAATAAVTIARQQYNVGLTDFVNVLNTQGTLLHAEDEQVQTQSAVAADLASLYKALGGGWTDAIPAVTGPATAAANPS
ncbi:MAG TPA: efflux transporter outer membrane subunit [Micropepsaceae bacterium]|nr:efflux transporter outer membrane subunit [Micropepsaceae bacterium]